MCYSVLIDTASTIYCIFFFFKQKTAYEMRISDWSSDVCSSDLVTYIESIYSGRNAHCVNNGLAGIKSVHFLIGHLIHFLDPEFAPALIARTHPWLIVIKCRYVLFTDGLVG